jgi:putative transposase
MATPPRISPPNSIHLVTHRTTQGEFLLRPEEPLTQNYFYLLGYMQQYYTIEFHTSCIMINHPHILLTDVLGDQLQRFNRHFFSLMARSTNCYRGRRENLWNTGKPNCVHIAPLAEDVIDHAAYIIVNPVEAELVSTAKKWPGLRVLASEMGRLEVRAKRPGFFYSSKGKMPEETVVRFTLPKVWDADPEELRLRISQECNLREMAIRERVRAKGRTFLGAKRVKRQSPQSKPKAALEQFGLIPHVACKDRALRKRMLEWRRERRKHYDETRALFAQGVKDLVFPEGTFVLHFHHGQAREPWTGCIWRRLAGEP